MKIYCRQIDTIDVLFSDEHPVSAFKNLGEVFFFETPNRMFYNMQIIQPKPF